MPTEEDLSRKLQRIEWSVSLSAPHALRGARALASKGISKEFKEWIAIAMDRPKWRQQTHSKPKPPDGCGPTEIWTLDKKAPS